MGRGVTPPL